MHRSHSATRVIVLVLGVGQATAETTTPPEACIEPSAAAREEAQQLQESARDLLWGDAHHNLAVVLLATGRLDEAEAEIERTEEAGVPVHPRPREEIETRRDARGRPPP
jgi:hypothetical protein